ncbi:MAG: hypothetical protein J0L92_39750, partial [Deltaproteobacteria bacterium]|nr:hypothetical protein [Deltaproteobacteria bacterium]
MRSLCHLLLALAFSLPFHLVGARASADDVLRVVEARLDRPTLHALGVQVLVTDDDDFDAEITVRVREIGGTFRDATPLLRVRPEAVAESVRASVPAQLAGSIFDLRPGTAYEIELHARDADGAVDEIRMLSGQTRPVPRSEAPAPRRVPVTDATTLANALRDAAPGDVIELSDGVYSGPFSIAASGTAEAPIVIRGATRGAVILDGGGCTDCNVLEVYGSHVHVERMTLRAAQRALRFQGEGSTGNVARWLRIEDVVHGIGSRPLQTDFYVCDNDLDGRLVWPWTFASDATSHWDDRGIDMNGDGHVVCHNRIRGFGDPIINGALLARSWDVYGNDILDCYDGTELDRASGNVRFWGNRWVNVMAAISLQPVYGGPAYVLRNVGLNIPEEQIKLKSLGGTDLPSGVLVWHNTWVSPTRALNLQTPITQSHFRLENNLFVGPASPPGRNVEWTAAIVDGVFDHDGFYPDSGYWLGTVDGSFRTFATLAEAQAAGIETNGVVLATPIFENGMVGPTGDGMARQEAPASFALAASSNAIDRGRTIAGINTRAVGAPDLGAWERGCPAPHYGPRAEGDESVTAIDCEAAITGSDDAGMVDAAGADAAITSDSGSAPTIDASGLDAGAAGTTSGCSCRAMATSARHGPWSLALAAFV